MSKPEREEYCGTCYFFQKQRDEDGEEIGKCRRYPPKFSDAMLYTLGLAQRECDDSVSTWESMLEQRDDTSNFVWPIVNTSDAPWCGEYKPDIFDDSL